LQGTLDDRKAESVSVYLKAATPADAWAQIMGHLLQQPHGKCFHLVTTISDPIAENRIVTQVVDALASAAETMSTMENANAIWPHVLARPGLPFETIMQRVKDVAVPVIKAANKRHSDSYMERLVAWRAKDSGEKVPQLENVIHRMRSELSNAAPKTSAYEIAIFSPGLDAGYMGFPCLCHLSFKLEVETKRVHLTALYRNHHFVTHGYGNFLGLGRLMKFVAGQADCGVGELMSVSTHADAELLFGKARVARAVEEVAAILRGDSARASAVRNSEKAAARRSVGM
jgi:thymidylate synthase